MDIHDKAGGIPRGPWPGRLRRRLTGDRKLHQSLQDLEPFCLDVSQTSGLVMSTPKLGPSTLSMNTSAVPDDHRLAFLESSAISSSACGRSSCV